MRIRLLHIIPSLDRAGAEKQLVLLAKGLPKDQFEVHVCALNRAGPLADELADAGIELTVIDKRWKLDPFAWRKLHELVARWKPHTVHSWLFAAGVYGRLVARRYPEIRSIHGERCVDLAKPRWMWSIDRRLARSTDCLVANSKAIRDHGAANGMPSEIYRIIPNGVAAPGVCEWARNQFAQELGLQDDKRFIAVVGRLWPQKRVKDLLWAMDLVEVMHPGVCMLVIGDGPQRVQLERFAEQACAPGIVRFLGHRNDVNKILPHCELLWQGSGYEGQPNSVMEAMSAGLPVVATDIPGHRDLVQHGTTGYLVPVGSRTELARATDRILADKNLATQLGRAGQERMAAEFSVDKMIDAYAKLYQQVVAEGAT